MSATPKSLEKTLIRVSKSVGSFLLKKHREIASGKSSLKTDLKNDKSLVTEVDLESEKRAIHLLKKKYPSFGYVSEETHSDALKKISEGDFFVIDPLDGTTNFVRGFPMFCFTSAAVVKGEVVAACTYHPVLKLCFHASLGGGSFLNNKRIKVSEVKSFHEAVLTTGFAYTKDSHLKKEIEAFANVSREARAVRRPGSAALDLAYTAMGVFDGFWEQNLKPWDTAAGYLLVKEAGGTVTDFKGSDFKLSSSSLLATNPFLKREFLKILT